MNWTGGPRSRHYQNNVRSTTNLQRQHFAKVRARPHPKTKPDAAACDQGSARTRWKPLPAPGRDAVFSLGTKTYVTNRHRLSKTADPRNTSPIASRKRKLLKRDDWVGTTITRPLNTRPTEDWQMIGRRRRPAGGRYRHRILSANEQVGLSDVVRGYVAREDCDDWTAGERGLVVRVGGCVVESAEEDMRGDHFGGLSSEVAPGLVVGLSKSRAAHSLAGGATRSLIQSDRSMVATLRVPRDNTRYTQGLEDGTRHGTWLSFSTVSKHGSSVGYRDTRSNKRIKLDTLASSPSDTRQDSSGFTTDATGYSTYRELVCGSSYAEEEEIDLKDTNQNRCKTPITRARSGSEGGGSFPTNTQERIRDTANSRRMEISNSSASRVRGGRGPGVSTTPDEIFWRSWLSALIGRASATLEVEEQTEISCTENRTKERTGGSWVDLNSTITNDVARISSMELDSLHHGTHSYLSKTSIVSSLVKLSRGGKGHEPSSANYLPVLNLKRNKRIKAYTDTHAWEKHDWEDESNGVCTDQFPEPGRPCHFPCRDTTSSSENALTTIRKDPVSHSPRSQRTSGTLLHPPTRFLNYSPTATRAAYGASQSMLPCSATQDQRQSSWLPEHRKQKVNTGSFDFQFTSLDGRIPLGNGPRTSPGPLSTVEPSPAPLAYNFDNSMISRSPSELLATEKPISVDALGGNQDQRKRRVSFRRPQRYAGHLAPRLPDAKHKKGRKTLATFTRSSKSNFQALPDLLLDDIEDD
ncbi:MAG: hypothetical protein M1839_001782 [Geoglossum umbratile]|nr:MAG: hypothetical protein M1839_001782 [Geoglossum umbratile]